MRGTEDADRLSEQAQRLLAQDGAAGRLDKVEQALSLLRAAASVPGEDSRRLAHLANLVMALRWRHELRGDAAVVDEATAVVREIAGILPDDHPDSVVYLTQIGGVLRLRHRHSGRTEDLDTAVTVLRRALARAGESHLDPLLWELRAVYEARFAATGAVDDLDGLLWALRVARDRLPGDDPERAAYDSQLGERRITLFELTGDERHLDAAIRCLRRAVGATRPPDPMALSNLGAGLVARYQQVADVRDLDEALAALGDARRLLPAVAEHRGEVLSNLAGAWLLRYERGTDPAHLSRAIGLFREAIAASPGDPRQRLVLGANLAGALQHTGDRADSHEAIDLLEAAVRGLSPEQPGYTGFESGLGGALFHRFQLDGAPGDLDAAIGYARRARDADRGLGPHNLGAALLERHRHGGVPADLDEALAMLEAGATQVGAPVTVRMRCARTWAEGAAESGRWNEAYRAHLLRLELLPLLAGPGRAHADRLHHLRLVDDLGPAAALAAVRRDGGTADEAWRLLEQARGVLLGQALEGHADGELRARHPGLADALDGLRARADTGRAAGPEDLAGLLAEIRTRPGFEDFGGPPTPAAMRRRLPDGVVVAIVAIEEHADALILSRTGADRVPLPELTESRVVSWANDLQAAAGGGGGRDMEIVGLDRAEPVTGVLAGLWDAVAGPVLDHLGYGVTSARPRIWWMPTGGLTVLPLHAAGHHGDPAGPGRRTVLDRVVSSYTPTVRLLTYQRRGAVIGDRVLLFGAGTVPGHRALPGAAEEIAAIGALLGDGVPVVAVPEARVDDVRARLPGARWAHFACHGTPAEDPMDSRLVLADGTLSAGELIGMDLGAGELAYMSACSTAFGGSLVADESIHLASAMRLAGFRHVIGTLWPISDRLAPRFAELVYRGLTSGEHPAVALHEAVCRMRADFPADPVQWAGHLHFGG